MEPPERSPAGRHALRYEFEPTGAPDLKTDKGLRVADSCTWTAA
jgi:hypothetical protein